MNNPKILVATLTSRKKDYCFLPFWSRINNLSYPEYDLFVSDNSQDSKYKEYLKRFFPNVRHVARNKPMPFTEVLCKSHNQIREFFLAGDYDFLLHIESDVIPPSNVIEALIHHRKSVVSAAYFHGIGENSWVLSYNKENIYNYAHSPSRVNHQGSDIYQANGKLREIHSCGLGCTLIHKSVLKQIEFTWVPGSVVTPDGFFYDYLMLKGFRAYLDTSLLCTHLNTDWGRDQDYYNRGIAQDSKPQIIV